MKPQTKYGLIGCGALIVWALIGFLMGNESYDTLKWPGYIIICIIMVYTMVMRIKEIRANNGGYISFGKAYGASAGTSLIMWLTYSVFSFFYFKFINPSMIDYIMDKTVQEWENANMSEEQIEQMTEMTMPWMNATVMAVMTFVWMMILSLLLALIIAAIMKKENPLGPFAEKQEKVNG